MGVGGWVDDVTPMHTHSCMLGMLKIHVKNLQMANTMESSMFIMFNMICMCVCMHVCKCMCVHACMHVGAHAGVIANY